MRSITLKRLWHSISFRLAVHYSLLTTLILLVVLNVVYQQTAGLLERRLERQITLSADRLVKRFENNHRETVIRDIHNLLTDDQNTNDEIYLLTDEDCQLIIGNMNGLPCGWHTDNKEIAKLQIIRWPDMQGISGGRMMKASLTSRLLSDGSILLVGHDRQELNNLSKLVIRASIVAAIIAVFLLSAGLFVFRWELQRSAGEIRRTAARIAAGNLQERISLWEGNDEFSRLANDINLMLDRIQSLMTGVRHVSDTIAHNLRTPLMRILVRLRHVSAKNALLSFTERQTMIDEVIREVEELAVVFEKLLEIAEADVGARRQQFTRVDLSQIARDVVELYEPKAQTLNIQIILALTPESIVMGDRDLLSVAIGNLIDNALKYAGEGAIIRVATNLIEQRVLFSVEDNGPGVAEVDHARLTRHFTRLNTQAVPGHGLGLAYVQAMMSLHGGLLIFTDAQPGLQVCLDFPTIDNSVVPL